MEKISKALLAYMKKHGNLPPAEYSIDGRALLSWRVLILDELGYPELRKQFGDDAWDTPRNKLLLDYIPPEYQSPERTDNKTNYLAVVGGGLCSIRNMGSGPIRSRTAPTIRWRSSKSTTSTPSNGPNPASTCRRSKLRPIG
jgi:hypothetical protein